MYRFIAAIFVHLLAFGFPREQPVESVTVTITQGTLKGKTETSSATGQRYHSFLGIPYAKPPLGSLRFKGPRDPESWSGVRDATTDGSRCVQRGVGSEDCLVLNVVTPELPDSSSCTGLKPVMVWIHGGSYQAGFGSPNSFRPDYLIAHGVVFVGINYRLGILGFLSLEGSDAPGNVGLKDQVAALRWVKANIGKFGGDPNNVTLFGESAGGSSVHHQMLSPLSNGLFQRAISESGAAMNPTGFFKCTRDRAFRLGKSLGLETHNSQDLVDFFRNMTALELVASQNNGLTEEEREKPLAAAFIPTTEYPVDGEEMFLVGLPRELTKKGQFKKIPYITGVNRDEGIIAYLTCPGPTCLSKVDSDFERVLPLNLGLEKGSEQSKKIAALVRQFYFQEKNVSEETRQNYIDLQTDIMYAYGCHYVVRQSVLHNVHNVFNYQFAYLREQGATGNSTPLVSGVNHGAEQQFIFYQPWHNLLGPDSTDKKVINTMVTMWTNFAKTGNPSINDAVTWKEATKDHHYYLKIEAATSLQEDLNKERMSLWDGIYTSLGF